MPEFLLERNRAWATHMKDEHPGLLKELAAAQHPRYFIVGCSDSRITFSQMMNALPGELFVHRNIANQTHATDLNFMACLQYAVDVLQVKHVIVCGHYQCGGIVAAMRGTRCGCAEHWIAPITTLEEKYRSQLVCLDEDARFDRLCEINAMEQIRNIAHTRIVRDAWERGQELALHAWVYRVSDGIIKNLNVSGANAQSVETSFLEATAHAS